VVFRSGSFDLRSAGRPRPVGIGLGFGLWFFEAGASNYSSTGRPRSVGIGLGIELWFFEAGASIYMYRTGVLSYIFFVKFLLKEIYIQSNIKISIRLTNP